MGDPALGCLHVDCLCWGSNPVPFFGHYTTLAPFTSTTELKKQYYCSIDTHDDS